MNEIGLFESIFGKKKSEKKVEQYFKVLNGYSPAFTSFDGGVYEMDLTRAAINRFATFCSKLTPSVQGDALKRLQKILELRPNPWQTGSQFIARVATILECENNAFIVPVTDRSGGIVGYFPIRPARCDVLDVDGVMFLRYTFGSGDKAAIEFSRVGLMTNNQYKDDLFGDSNATLKPTLQLLHSQNEAIVNAVKQSANIRFLAKIANYLDPADVKAARDQFSEQNLTSENQSQVIAYDQTFTDVTAIESKPYTPSKAQMEMINENVYTHFGTNAAILQNKYDEDAWGAYYEGKIEPFAIQLSQAMTAMSFSATQLSYGNMISFSSNRLQYASNKTKLEVSTQLFDRAILNRDGVREVWNMPPVDGGEKYYIRRDYAEVSELGKDQDPPPPAPKPEPVDPDGNTEPNE